MIGSQQKEKLSITLGVVTHFLKQGQAYSNNYVLPNSATPYGPSVVFKYMCLWELFLFRIPQGTYTARGKGCRELIQ